MLAILKKWKLWIFGGIALVAFAYTADPIISFTLKVFDRKSHSRVQENPHWQRFTNRASGYVIEFPSKPFKRPVTLNNNSAVVSYQQFVSVLGTNNCFMVATLVESFTNNFTEEQIDFMLERSAKGALGADGKLLAKRNINLGTNPGKEIEIQKDDNNFLKMRVYKVGHNLQELTVLLPMQNQQSTNASHFFDSFSLISQ